MSTSRDTILRRLRQLELPPRQLPSLEGPWIQFDDPRRQFAEQLSAVGGTAHEAGNLEETRALLAGLLERLQAQKVFSDSPDVHEGNLMLSADDDPHTVESLDLAIVRGEFAVAENAAVWVTDRHLPHRVVLFWAEHLVLLVPCGAVVSNMYQAYARIGAAPGSYGVFVSGPSKTADIEQSLVIGAQGPRSLNVIFAPLPD